MLRPGLIAALIFLLLVAFLMVAPSKPSLLASASGAIIALAMIVHYISSAKTVRKRVGNGAFWIPLVSLSMLIVFLPVFFAAALYVWGALSLFTWLLVIGLTIVFYTNFLSVPLAIYHQRREKKEICSYRYFPPITVVIPAYNEEKVVRKAIETVLEASYPNKEIIVIDDGSTDHTYRIAFCYGENGVKVIHRPN